MRGTTLLALVMVVACDGDGCYGGPTGPASKFCQGEVTRLGLAPANQADFCKHCCIQEVPYEGKIEDGLCVCRR